jgi:hypothetical protein
VVQLLENATGAVVVTTPQDLSVADVRRCITFCRRLNLPVLGVVAVMLAGRKEDGTSTAGTSKGKDRRTRPSRCCGEFLPDCRGCPYFRRRLFRSEDGDAVGYCTFYDRILRENRPRDGQGSDARGETVSTGDGSR